ncbi:non-ribosomal peptide synthetase [Methylocaldum marinum]|uniref:non-ribosomal peptide synthetase n=1 Tax=Methylocaldum marinum TaxID=1432792 RepID=UPI0018D4F8C0|nr:non-ribosomal peptide synthetase [Methylocaldum marinum]
MIDKIKNVLPLSAAQTGMWFMQKFSSPDSIFNLAESIEIHGPIDPALFEAALRQAAMEADTVRVRFIEEIDGPRQIVAPSFDGDIPFIDVSTEPDPRAAERWMMAELTRPVDLLTGQLWASALFKVAPDRFLWYHRSHHIIMDGFTGGLFARRVADLYTALVEGRPAPEAGAFGPLSLLIEEEAIYRESERFTRDREYWLGRFGDRPEPLSLASRRSPNIGGLLRQTSHLSSESVDRLQRIAQTAGASLPQIVIAATAAYLYRVTGVEDLVIGLPVTARTNSRLRCVPGMLANAVPLRLAMAPDMSMSELLHQVGREVRQVLRHQRYRYEDLRRDLNLMADNRHLFSMVINIEPFDYDLRFAGHPVTVHNLSNGSVDDLAIFVYDRGDGKGLRIDFDANPALYCAEDLAAHQRRFLRLVDSISRGPGLLVGRIDILDPVERRQVLVDWNDTAHPIPKTTLPAQLEAQASRRPKATALVFDDGVLSYAELNARANRLAHFLIGRGGGPERIVAVALPRSADMIIGLLAVLKTGAAYLPIDPNYPAERIDFICQDAGPACVITNTAIAPGLPEAMPRIILDRTETAEALALAPDTNPGDAERILPLSPHHAAYVIYTSGSTGTPKGVVVPHAGMPNLAEALIEHFGITSESRILQFASFSFDASVMELLMTFPAGAALVVPPPGALVGEILADTLKRHAVSHALIPPAVLAGLPPDCFEDFRTLIVGGDACPPDLIARWSEGRRMINAYGPTEATICATLSQDLSGAVMPSLGRPIRNTRIYVLDRALQPVPAGITGEIYIAGEGLARGYLGRPDLTAERFIADPFGPPGTRMYRTGDLARWRPDGALDFLGRIDHQVKIRGFRIEPGEIEAALVTHPGVAQAVVIACGDRPDDKHLVAYVVPAPGCSPSPSDLHRHLAETLPDYMAPAIFVTLDALPLTANGKLDRKALPAPERQATSDYTAPRTPTEKVLADLWAETFGLERVGVHDNFFELGGNSLLVTHLAARIQAAFSVELPLGMVFEVSTIAGLAERLDEALALLRPVPLPDEIKADSPITGFDPTGIEREPPALLVSEGTDTPDLSRDLSLPAHIKPWRECAPGDAKRIFLTGATGFVGSHLLANLMRETDAHIVCHVRAPSRQSAQARLKQALDRRKLSEVWDAHRIDVLTGNLADPNLGLDESGIALVRDECDAIYHCGAQVDFLQPYSTLKPANVDSLVTLLDWTANGRPKSLHYISTLGVIDPTAGTDPVSEESDLQSWRGLVGGYNQSKWIGDSLARQAQARGLPVAIYRLGSVTGDYAHAICNETDLIWRLFRICAELEAVPDLDVRLNMAPADDVARAIVRLSSADASRGRVYHPMSGEALHMSDIPSVFDRLGLRLDLVSLDHWMDRARNRLAESYDDDLSAVLSILSKYDSSAAAPEIRSDATRARLEALGAAIRPVSQTLLERYLINLEIQGLLDLPRPCEARA